NHCGDSGICRLLNGHHELHVWGGPLQLKELRNMLNGYRPREGAEVLPVFDTAIHSLLHFRGQRTREDAAVSKRPGAAFHPSLKPTYNLPGCKPLDRISHNVVGPAVLDGSFLCQCRLDFSFFIVRAGKDREPGIGAWHSHFVVANEQGRTQCTTVVSWYRGNMDSVEKT